MKVTIYAGTKTEVLAKLAELAQAERELSEKMRTVRSASDIFFEAMNKQMRKIDSAQQVENEFNLSIKDFKK